MTYSIDYIVYNTARRLVKNFIKNFRGAGPGGEAFGPDYGKWKSWRAGRKATLEDKR